jgi:hypothetical protein
VIRVAPEAKVREHGVSCCDYSIAVATIGGVI